MTLKLRGCIALLSMMILIAALSGCKGEAEETFPGEKTTPYEVGDSFTVNVVDNEKKYVYCSVVLDLTDPAMADVLTSKNHWIRDIVIEVLRSRTLAELESAEIMQTVSDEVKMKVNEKFNTDTIFNVAFTNYYIK